MTIHYYNRSLWNLPQLSTSQDDYYVNDLINIGDILLDL